MRRYSQFKDSRPLAQHHIHKVSIGDGVTDAPLSPPRSSSSSPGGSWGPPASPSSSLKTSDLPGGKADLLSGDRTLRPCREPEMTHSCTTQLTVTNSPCRLQPVMTLLRSQGGALLALSRGSKGQQVGTWASRVRLGLGSSFSPLGLGVWGRLLHLSGMRGDTCLQPQQLEG